MPRVYDDKWFEKQLHDHPPGHYKITVSELSGLLVNSSDVCFALAASYNYGFRRGRNCERNALKRKKAGKR